MIFDTVEYCEITTIYIITLWMLFLFTDLNNEGIYSILCNII